MDSALRNGLHIGPTMVGCLLGLACASSLPAVLTSTPDAVSVEFAVGGSLTEAAALAKQECEKVGKVAEFSQVRKEATPSSRVAQFVCVESEAGAEAPSSDAGSP